MTYKGPMRRRYNVLIERYKGYIIYSYIRGEYTRYSVEDDKENIFVETDNIEDVYEYIDNELTNNMKLQKLSNKIYSVFLNYNVTY